MYIACLPYAAFVGKGVMFLMLLPVITSLPSSLKLVIPCVTLQACLVYLEGILIAQYLFQIPAHLHCRAVSRSTEVHRCHRSQLAFAAAVLADRCCQILLPVVSRSPAWSACMHCEQGQCYSMQGCPVLRLTPPKSNAASGCMQDLPHDSACVLAGIW